MEAVQRQSEALWGFIYECLEQITVNEAKKITASLGIAMAIYHLSLETKTYFQCRKLRQKVKKLQNQRHKSIKRMQDFFPVISPRQHDIVGLDFPALKQQLQEGQLSAVEVLEAFQAKAVQVHQETNAITQFITDSITRAKGLDSLPKEARGPLHGMPMSLTEQIHLEGEDCTLGMASRIGRPTPRDAELVRILKHLGAIPFCRTNLPQASLSFDCSNPIFGPTLNPTDPKRSPGGSSGGEGALIGAGGSVMGFGTDMCGSTRIAAHFSGITSLKPTAGRLPLSGQGQDGGLVGVVGLFPTLGLMARSAEAIEDCMRSLLKEDKIHLISRDARFCPLAWNNQLGNPGNKLRVGWYDFDGCMEATPGVRRAVREAILVLQDQGHEVIRFCPPGLDKLSTLCAQFMDADGGQSTLMALGRSDLDHPALGPKHWARRWSLWLRRWLSSIVRFKSPIWADLLVTNEHASKSAELWELNNYRLELTEHILREWDRQGIDVVIAPGMTMPAQPLGYPSWQLSAISYNCVYNVLNFPAGSLPVSKESESDQEALEDYPGYEKDSVYGWIKDGTRGALGMSLNVQVVGRPWHEELVLRVMRDLQAGLDSEPRNSH